MFDLCQKRISLQKIVWKSAINSFVRKLLEKVIFTAILWRKIFDDGLLLVIFIITYKQADYKSLTIKLRVFLLFG